jgi:hypothetical protein
MSTLRDRATLALAERRAIADELTRNYRGLRQTIRLSCQVRQGGAWVLTSPQRPGLLPPR